MSGFFVTVLPRFLGFLYQFQRVHGNTDKKVSIFQLYTIQTGFKEALRNPCSLKFLKNFSVN